MAKPKSTGKKFRQNAKDLGQPKEKGRNWAELETEAFCTVLADAEYNYEFTLESKALKKTVK